MWGWLLKIPARIAPRLFGKTAATTAGNAALQTTGQVATHGVIDVGMHTAATQATTQVVAQTATRATTEVAAKTGTSITNITNNYGAATIPWWKQKLVKWGLITGAGTTAVNSAMIYNNVQQNQAALAEQNAASASPQPQEESVFTTFSKNLGNSFGPGSIIFALGLGAASLLIPGVGLLLAVPLALIGAFKGQSWLDSLVKPEEVATVKAGNQSPATTPAPNSAPQVTPTNPNKTPPATATPPIGTSSQKFPINSVEKIGLVGVYHSPGKSDGPGAIPLPASNSEDKLKPAPGVG